MQKRRMTPGEWFGMADQFTLTAQLVVEHANRTGYHLAFPQVACRAFSAEAYLKCLLTLREKQFPPAHNLRTLFRLLPSDDRHEIEARWNAETLPHVLRAATQNPPQDFVIPTTFQQCLKRSAGAFTEWRYNTKETRYWWLGAFPTIVRERIIEIKPAWRDSPPGPLPAEPQA